VGSGDQLGPLGTTATERPVVPVPGDYDDREISGMFGRGKQTYSEEKTYPNATLSTTNPTCCQDANPGRQNWKPASNRFSYDATYMKTNSYRPFVHIVEACSDTANDIVK
jgi:hypothetical protein